MRRVAGHKSIHHPSTHQSSHPHQSQQQQQQQQQPQPQQPQKLSQQIPSTGANNKVVTSGGGKRQTNHNHPV